MPGYYDYLGLEIESINCLTLRRRLNVTRINTFVLTVDIRFKMGICAANIPHVPDVVPNK